MHFKLNQIDTQKLEKLFATKAMNISLSELALDLINAFENDDLASEFADCDSLSAYINQVKDLYEFDPEDDFQVELFERLSRMIKTIDLSAYQANPYYQTIKDIKLSDKSLKFLMKQYESKQLFILDDVTSVGPYFEENLKLAYSLNPFPYLALVEHQKIWMAIIPHEINTMKQAIERAHGHVLVLGLGLGYYPFMISAKDDVKDITIIEKNPKTIALFTQAILPLFPHQEKIKIVQSDAYQYLKQKHANFDYAFFDIYRDSQDFNLYLKAKQNEVFYPTLTIDYWLEDTMIAYLRRIVISLIEEEYYAYEVEGESELDAIILPLKEKLSAVIFTDYEGIVRLLEKDQLIELIKQKKFS